MSDAGNPLTPPGGGPTPGLASLNRGAPLKGGAPPSVMGGRTAAQTTAGPAGNGPGMFDHIHKNFDAAKKMYDDSMKAFELTDHIRREMDDLVALGDSVRPEDVIQAAGRMVGNGIGAENLAQLMSDMPAIGGQGLASWLRMHDNALRNTEAQLAKKSALYQHTMGVAGIRSLASSQIHQEAEQAIQGARQGEAGMAPRGVGAMMQPASQAQAPQSALAPTGEGDQESG